MTVNRKVSLIKMQIIVRYYVQQVFTVSFKWKFIGLIAESELNRSVIVSKEKRAKNTTGNRPKKSVHTWIICFQSPKKT